MSIFTNIHKIASRMIPREWIEYRIAKESITDEYGVRRSTFGEWTRLFVHAQPGIISSFGGKNLDEKDYKDMGLDFSHKFVTIWFDSADINTVYGGDSADQVKIRGKIFNVIQTADWIDFNGWKRAYCEEAIGYEHEEQESS